MAVNKWNKGQHMRNKYKILSCKVLDKFRDK